MTAQQRHALRVGDRRSERRYAIAANLEYRVICDCQVIQTGIGRTVNLSKSGILFESEEMLPAGTEMEVSIAWPVRLRDTVALNFCVSGRISWSRGKLHALTILRHEFCVRGRYGLSSRRVSLWPEVRPDKEAPQAAAASALLSA
jgi:hypothetical protein